MTPGTLITYARQQYNASNDSFFSDAELYGHIFQAQMEFAKEAKAIEETYQTTTVSGTQEYAMPTNSLAVKRITYNGIKLTLITQREDDAVTGLNAATTATGTPAYYWVFDRTIYLRPIPDAAYTLKIFSYDMPGDVSSTSTLDVPVELHRDMVFYLLWLMAAKDQNFQSADYYQRKWNEAVMKAKSWSRKRAIADQFASVKDEEALANTVFGAV
jgi:hypothetical protein